MLKDLRLINEVVREQRQLTSLLVAKLYRLLKSTSKLFDDTDYQQNINLRELTKKQISENFRSLDVVIIFFALKFTKLGKTEKNI